MNPATPTLDWLWYALAAALALAGLWLAYFALLRDRGRGRRRCPGCWYSMEGIRGTTCPECGKHLWRERRLVRTRRRWGVAMLAALLLLAATITSRIPAVQRDGWLSLVPSTVLVLAADPEYSPSRVPVLSGIPLVGQAFAPTGSGPWRECCAEEAWARAGSDRLWNWQAAILTTRHLHAKQIDPRTFLTAPPRWVQAEPVPILNKSPGSWPVMAGTWPGKTEVLESTGRWSSSDLVSAAPATSVKLRLLFRGKPVYHTSVPIATAFVPAAELLKPVSGPEIDLLVLAALSPSIVRGNGGELRIILGDRAGGPQWDALDLGIGCTIRVLIDGQEAGTGRATVSWDYPIWSWRLEPKMTWPGGIAPIAPASADRVQLIIESDGSGPTRQYRRFPFDKPAAAWKGRLSITPGYAPGP
jgi:hypothetical protein